LAKDTLEKSARLQFLLELFQQPKENQLKIILVKNGLAQSTEATFKMAHALVIQSLIRDAIFRHHLAQLALQD
jgi:hypothetical protein